jgi:hypothetical protein
MLGWRGSGCRRLFHLSPVSNHAIDTLTKMGLSEVESKRERTEAS